MQRPTAFKVWISDLVGKEFVIDESEQNPSYILINNNKVNRVNIIASVIQKYSNGANTYTDLVLDDSSGTIRIKSWREDTNLLADINVGDVINVIGRVRKYQDEVYITPIIIKKLDSAWIIARKAELTKLYGEPNKTENKAVENIVEEKIVDDGVNDNIARQKLVDLISRYEDGIDTSEVIKESTSRNSASLIQELIKEGEIFEFKGKLRLVS
ncbi:MAG: OB-fold nucleic acid binding domain-containing protein [Nanoarchaeota archaeon]